MYSALGIHWASSVPAFLALACVPFPFIFYKYGAQIRARCVYAAQAEAVMEKLRAQANAGVAPVPRQKPTTELSRSTTEGTNAGTESGSDDTDVESLRGTRTRESTSGAVERAQLTRTKSRAESIPEAANYNASPYDIDRIYTSTSVAGLETTQTKTNRSAGRKA